MSFVRRTALCLALLTVPGTALAHHSFSMYDSEKLLLLDGTIKEFQWTNPHAIVWVNGTTVPGQPPELWTVELPTSPGNLSRMGWKRTSLAPGDPVIVEINPLRDGRHGGSFKKATLKATGAVLIANVRDEPPAGAAGAPADVEKDHDHDSADEHSSCEVREGSPRSPAPSFGLSLLALAAAARRALSRARRQPH
jgi:hypothetical protein